MLRRYPQGRHYRATYALASTGLFSARAQWRWRLPCCESSGDKTWLRGIVHRSSARKTPLVGTTAVFARSCASPTSNIKRLRNRETAKTVRAASNRPTSAREHALACHDDRNKFAGAAAHRCERRIAALTNAQPRSIERGLAVDRKGGKRTFRSVKSGLPHVNDKAESLLATLKVDLAPSHIDGVGERGTR